MSATTTIEWTERTWNPTTGCDRISPGCEHCYALTLAARLKNMGQPRYQLDGNPHTSGPGFAVTLHPEALDEPHRWRKPQIVFVNSMSDLFHARVPYEFVERVWSTMAETKRHRYQVLTKRPDRMARFVARLVARFGVLPNVWLGTSIESQAYVGRARYLLQTPAAIRFLSCEPLLGSIDLAPVLWGTVGNTADYFRNGRLMHGGIGGQTISSRPLDAVHWVIAGGESGHGARPCELDWLRSLRDQCQAAGVSFFLKQLGSVAMAAQGVRGKGGHLDAVLDGRRWLEMPA